MYKIKEEKIHSLVEKLRVIRKLSDEAISSLEYLVSTQGEFKSVSSEYNPDDYLEKLMSCTVRDNNSMMNDECSERSDDDGKYNI